MTWRRAPLLRGSGITKVYGNLVALKRTDFTLMPGEVRALIGSNGAGKSTLVKILTGAIAPTEGSVEIAGQSAPLGDPREMMSAAWHASISTRISRRPCLSSTTSISAASPRAVSASSIHGASARRPERCSSGTGSISISTPTSVALPTVKQKEVEILKALALDAKVILMDEPTGWLAASEVAKLHDTIRALKARGVGIIYISHVLDEIFAVCDTMTIMRDGKWSPKVVSLKSTGRKVVQLMVGETARPRNRSGSHVRRAHRRAAMANLRLDRAESDQTRVSTEDVSFDLYAGEILCITGLIGSRRTDLMHTLFGSDRFDNGTLDVDGKPVRFLPVAPLRMVLASCPRTGIAKD